MNMQQIIRNQQQIASQLLEHFPIIALTGARQVGKTTLAKQLCPNWRYVDLENPDDFDRISQDPVFISNNLTVM